MGLLFSIDRCLNALPKDLLAENIVYIELDKDKYELLQTEITTHYDLVSVPIAPDLKFIEQKVEDFGKCSVFTYNDYKIVVALGKGTKQTDTFYVAFRTKVL